MKKIKVTDDILYLVLTYSFACLFGFLKKNEVPNILKIENLNFGYIGIFMLLLVAHLSLYIKHYKSGEKVLIHIGKSILFVGIFLMGLNYPKGWMVGILIYLLTVCFIPMFIQEEEEKDKLELYSSRKNQKEILERAIKENSLIALDGSWGSGKTTFMDIVMRENREDYYYISINIMLFEDRDSLKTEFLNQLKVIFKEEGIFQGSLMDFDYYLDGISNDWLKMVKNIMFSKSKSFKDANENLKNEIGKIEKTIVVGVDNLERIYGKSEPEWKQILGFIYELQEIGIKIVVMSNIEKMLTKKENGEKDLTNHEYFDKFYEFKLKLNEVTTEEIIDEVKFKDDGKQKKELKKQFRELNYKINIKFKEMKEKRLELRAEVQTIKEDGIIKDTYINKMKKDEEEIQKLNIKMLEFERYYENIINPRKVEKVIKDIEIKKEKKSIYNYVDGEVYKKLILRSSIFSQFYYDYMNEIKGEDFQIFKNGNTFFSQFFYGQNEYSRPIKRLLFYDSKEDLVIERIKSLILTKEIRLFNLENKLKD